MADGTREYSLLGRDGRTALATGLAGAHWYQTDIPRKQLAALMQRRDGPAIRDTVILFTAMVSLGAAGALLFPSWLALPAFLAYGVLYGSAMDSRWHECGHKTAFKSRWLNDVVYQIACFCMIRNPYSWRWSHARHHTDTIIVGRDPEIQLMRPPAFLKWMVNFLGLIDVPAGIKRMLVNASGRLDPQEASFIPEIDHPKVIRVARIWVLIYAGTIATAVMLGSWIPVLLVGTPRLYGAWHHVMTGMLQHGGLADNVVDHRLNSRTVHMNLVSRFIYWNMNYHIEHHMFPKVPFHALPELHKLIRHDLPAPSPSIAAGFAEMWPALVRQLRNEDFFIRRELPDTAQPYRELNPPDSAFVNS